MIKCRYHYHNQKFLLPGVDRRQESSFIYDMMTQSYRPNWRVTAAMRPSSSSSFLYSPNAFRVLVAAHFKAIDYLIAGSQTHRLFLYITIRHTE